MWNVILFGSSTSDSVFHIANVNPGGGSTVNDSGWLDLRRQPGTAVFSERLPRAGMGYHLSRPRLPRFQKSAERTRAGPTRVRLRTSAIATHCSPASPL